MAKQIIKNISKLKEKIERSNVKNLSGSSSRNQNSQNLILNYPSKSSLCKLNLIDNNNSFMKDIKLKHIQNNIKTNKPLLDQTSEAYYGIKNNKMEAYTSKNKLQRNHSYNFNSMTSGKQNKVPADLSNFGCSLSFTNRVKNNCDYDQSTENKHISLRPINFFSQSSSNSSGTDQNRSISKRRQNLVDNIKISKRTFRRLINNKVSIKRTKRSKDSSEVQMPQFSRKGITQVEGTLMTDLTLQKSTIIMIPNNHCSKNTVILSPIKVEKIKSTSHNVDKRVSMENNNRIEQPHVSSQKLTNLNHSRSFNELNNLNRSQKEDEKHFSNNRKYSNEKLKK